MEYVDFGKRADDYRKHRAGFPPELFDELKRFGVGVPGQRLVDLGTGTGTLARSFALAGCEVTGIDVSGEMLEQAKVMAEELGVSIAFYERAAEDTGLASEAFDVVSAGQCWHWFHRSKAAAEAYRLLKRGGKLVIAHFDWLPLPGNVVEATEQLIVAHNSQWKLGGGVGIHPRFLPGLSVVGFTELRTFSFDVDVPYSHQAWRGRIRASAGIGPSLLPEAVERFDREHAELLATRFAHDPLGVPHRVWAIVAAKP